MKGKKILAAVLAATMVMGSAVTAFATDVTTKPATGGSSGSGQVEGIVDTEVFRVVLPTVTDNLSDLGNSLSFTLDPQQLLEKTNAAAYGNAEFESDATLFFANTTTGGAVKYSSQSDPLIVTNKSSVPTSVTVTAKVTSGGSMTLAADKAFEDDTSAYVYMAVKVGDDETAISADGATVTGSIEKAPDGAYEYSYDNSGAAYKYELKADLTGITFDTYEFNIVGAANSDADWTNLKDSTPSLDLTWTVEPAAKAYVTSSTVSSTSRTTGLSLPAGVKVKSVVITKKDGTKATLELGNTYTMSVAGDKLGFKDTLLANNVGGSIAITYSDGNVDTLAISK